MRGARQCVELPPPTVKGGWEGRLGEKEGGEWGWGGGKLSDSIIEITIVVVDLVSGKEDEI
jgi:hypothetical protein